ncbi:MAG: hypothetical protein IT304_09010 [Dehalococcoidia bacterium]|nr:hypothetical protein [Dehalococcoidia bacterium]
MAGRPFTPEQTAYILSDAFTYSGYLQQFPDDDRSPESLARHRRRRREDGRESVVETDDGSLTVALPASDEEWRDYLHEAEEAGRKALALSITQRQTVWTPRTQHLPVALAFTGDWHLGARGVDYAALDASLEQIATTPGLYAVGMGDYFEGVNIHVKASPSLYSGVYNNGDEQERAVRMRADVLRRKWVAFLSGNHDEWVYRHAGLSRCDKIAQDLGCAHFGEGGGTIYVHLGDQRYAVGVRHKFGGRGATVPRRMIDEWPEWERLHVAVMAHLHFNEIQRVSRNGGRVWALRSGAFKTEDDYAAALGFVPEIGTPIAIFYPDEERVVAFAGDDFEAALTFLDLERARHSRAAA